MGCWEAATKPGRKIRFALEKAGVQFIDDNDGGRGVVSTTKMSELDAYGFRSTGAFWEAS